MNNNIFEDKRKRNLLIILCTFLWGSAFPVLKISYRELGLSSMDILSVTAFSSINIIPDMPHSSALLRTKISQSKLLRPPGDTFLHFTRQQDDVMSLDLLGR